MGFPILVRWHLCIESGPWWWPAPVTHRQNRKEKKRKEKPCYFRQVLSIDTENPYQLSKVSNINIMSTSISYCPACRTTFIATRFRVAVICPIIPVPHCIRVFFYFVWFVFINHIFQFYYELFIPVVTFWIFTYHKIWILSIMFCFIWSYWIIYFLACL